MIIQKLIAQHLRYKTDSQFHLIQARDAIRWMQKCGVRMGPGVRALDLGCGHGLFGSELLDQGCRTEFADQADKRRPQLIHAPFHQINLDRDALASVGQFDLVVCSNVLEHLSRHDQFIDSVHEILSPGGKLYLSWTNWLSPWGGHEFSPFHYLGSSKGHLLYDKLTRRSRRHTPFENLFPTYIGKVLGRIKAKPNLTIINVAPRYYTELSFLVKIPLLREVFTWNCALLIGRKSSSTA